jgi:hypothetical protein
VERDLIPGNLQIKRLKRSRSGDRRNNAALICSHGGLLN